MATLLKVQNESAFKLQLRCCIYIFSSEIDENLLGPDLTIMERGEHLSRRKIIYETLYPKSKQYSSEKQSGRRTEKPGAFIAPGFVQDRGCPTITQPSLEMVH